jgi:hypothetical protein
MVILLRDKNKTRINVSHISTYSTGERIYRAPDRSSPVIELAIGSAVVTLVYLSQEDLTKDMATLDALMHLTLES